jgi:hypothetical protein
MADVAGEAGETVAKGFGEMIDKLASGEAICHSNEAINKIGNNLLGGGEFLAKLFKNQGGLTEAFDSTFREAGEKIIDESGKEVEKRGALNLGKIAGSYIGLSAAYRVASGGGLYRDKNGNNNIIGIPFV